MAHAFRELVGLHLLRGEGVELLLELGDLGRVLFDVVLVAGACKSGFVSPTVEILRHRRNVVPVTHWLIFTQLRQNNDVARHSAGFRKRFNNSVALLPLAS